MSKRAERRYHLRRMKAKAEKLYPWAGERAHKWANNLCMCSRYCCGNHRRWGKGHSDPKLTRQEIIAEMKLRDE